MRVRFLRSFFGCCELRTAVIVIAILDIIFGLYEIVDFAIRVYLETHYTISKPTRSTKTTLQLNGTLSNGTLSNNGTTSTQHAGKGELYSDSAFAIIVIGCLDLFISSFLLYVALLRKYELRVVVFVAAIWGFVMAFLNFISFGITLSLGLTVEFVLFGIVAVLETFFGYVILSYFHFMTVVVERGLDDVNMVYYADDSTVVTTGPSELVMDEPQDERYIMDDQDDFPEFGDDGNIPLT